MKASELKTISVNDLQKKLTELRKKTQELRFSIANNQLTKVREMRNAKKEIARILTVLKQKLADNK